MTPDQMRRITEAVAKAIDVEAQGEQVVFAMYVRSASDPQPSVVTSFPPVTSMGEVAAALEQVVLLHSDLPGWDGNGSPVN